MIILYQRVSQSVQLNVAKVSNYEKVFRQLGRHRAVFNVVFHHVVITVKSTYRLQMLQKTQIVRTDKTDPNLTFAPSMVGRSRERK